MVRIKIIRDDAKNIQCFEASGHAGYSKHGEDIVCSAVSMLAQTAVLGLKYVAQVKTQFKKIDKIGYLKCQLPGELDEKQRVMATAILETMYLGLRNLELSYKKHIDIRENEEV